MATLCRNRGMVSTSATSLTSLVIVLLFPLFLHGEVVHITVLTVGYSTIETRSRIEYQCYRSAPDENATLEFGRLVQAPSLTAPAPPAAAPHFNDPDIKVVSFPDTNSWHTDGVGVFYCQGTKPGRDVTTVSTFFKRSDAKFVPSDDVFTRTVNIGDTGVVIRMNAVSNPDNDASVIMWHKDGGGRILSQEGSTSYTFANPIELSDEGVYEIHYDTERNTARGALFRLIVRDCPAGKYGPPSCAAVCDKCYNGGICDDKSGRCICPNNFRGPNCLTICRSGGGNRFGLNCEFRCTYKTSDPVDGCHSLLFCLPDPFGCSCDVGVKGLACSTACSSGEFGAGCTQTCHCASGTCDRYTGECAGGCATGWSGANCQITANCDHGYYGSNCTDKCHCLNDASCDKMTGECRQRQCASGYQVYDGQVNCQECQGAFFGLNCIEACHCQESACDKVTGICSGLCLSNWLIPDCQTRVARIDSNIIVNPGQPAQFTCHVYGNPPPDAASVSFYRDFGGSNDQRGIMQQATGVSGYERQIEFLVNDVSADQYTCVLSNSRNLAYLAVNSRTYILPTMNGSPGVSNIAAITVDLAWTAWTLGEDIGDPPLVAYTIYYKSSITWMEGQTVSHSETSTTLTGLQPDTDYVFSVAAVREGPGGTGPRSSITNATTLCGPPSSAPAQIVSIVNDSLPRQLTVMWQVPDPGAAECRSGFTHYVIYYVVSTSDTTSSERIDDPTVTEFIITRLETYLEYTIYMTAANKDEESDHSSEMIARTPEELAPSPVNVNIPRSTPNSFTVRWSAAQPINTNGNIMRYELQYRRAAQLDAGVMVIPIDDTALDVEYTVEGLPPESNYSIQVRTINGVGTGIWSAPVNAKTVYSGDKSCTCSNTPWVLFAVAVAGNMLLASVIVVLCLRWKGSKSQTPSFPLPPKTTNQLYPCHVNPSFSVQDADIHTYEDLRNKSNNQDGDAYETPMERDAKQCENTAH